MVERGKAPPKPGIPNPSRGGNRILEAELATGNNGNQGKCLGTKPGALQRSLLSTSTPIVASALRSRDVTVPELTRPDIEIFIVSSTY